MFSAKSKRKSGTTLVSDIPKQQNRLSTKIVFKEVHSFIASRKHLRKRTSDLELNLLLYIVLKDSYFTLSNACCHCFHSYSVAFNLKEMLFDSI